MPAQPAVVVEVAWRRVPAADRAALLALIFSAPELPGLSPGTETTHHTAEDAP